MWLQSFPYPEGQAVRLREGLQKYHFDCEHQGGAKHWNAHALPRCPTCDHGNCPSCTITSFWKRHCKLLSFANGLTFNWRIPTCAWFTIVLLVVCPDWLPGIWLDPLFRPICTGTVSKVVVGEWWSVSPEGFELHSPHSYSRDFAFKILLLREVPYSKDREDELSFSKFVMLTFSLNELWLTRSPYFQSCRLNHLNPWTGNFPE